MGLGTFLELLETFKGDFKLVGRVERRGIVPDLDTEERDDRHLVQEKKTRCIGCVKLSCSGMMSRRKGLYANRVGEECVVVVMCWWSSGKVK